MANKILADFVVVGAGIVGLSMARELCHRFPDANIVMLEKENTFGLHASGRNSGVLHSGIYYPEDSLKFQICASGAKLMADYCEENKLPIKRVGKVVMPVRPGTEAQLKIFLDRAQRLKVPAHLIDSNALKEIEPDAKPEPAIYLPNVSVIDAKSILSCIVKELKGCKNFNLFLNRRVTGVNSDLSILYTQQESIEYGFLVNAAGAYVDRIAHWCGVGQEYVMLPFRGSYYKVAKVSSVSIRGLIYPVPDARMPFLGIHFTRAIDGTVYVGPSAVPALGREHYRNIQGVDYRDIGQVFAGLTRLYINNYQGFRQHVGQEIECLLKKGFAAAAAEMVPKLRQEHLIASDKVGIRPQLYNKTKNRLVMDFKIVNGLKSLHILNSISPAFTSAFGFASWALRNVK